MELQGKIIAVLPAREGTSARGPWKSQEYVIETHDQYPKKMVFNVFAGIVGFAAARALRSARFTIHAVERRRLPFQVIDLIHIEVLRV